jgi:hypothetical protein
MSAPARETPICHLRALYRLWHQRIDPRQCSAAQSARLRTCSVASTPVLACCQERSRSGHCWRQAAATVCDGLTAAVLVLEAVLEGVHEQRLTVLPLATGDGGTTSDQ